MSTGTATGHSAKKSHSTTASLCNIRASLIQFWHMHTKVYAVDKFPNISLATSHPFDIPSLKRSTIAQEFVSETELPSGAGKWSSTLYSALMRPHLVHWVKFGTTTRRRGLGARPEKATKLVKDLEQKFNEKQLREPWFFSLEKKRLRAELITLQLP